MDSAGYVDDDGLHSLFCEEVDGEEGEGELVVVEEITTTTALVRVDSQEEFEVITPSTLSQHDEDVEMADSSEEEAEVEEEVGDCDSSTSSQDDAHNTSSVSETSEASEASEASEVSETSETSEQDDEEKGGEEGEWVSFEVPQADEELEEFKVEINTAVNRKVSASSEEITSTSIEETEDSFETTPTSTQLQLVLQQNALHKKTIKQLQNALINVQEDCATYEDRFNRLKGEADKVYNTLFSRAARVKELTKQNDALTAASAHKDQIIYNQRLHLEEFKNSASDKSLDVLEWQTKYERANDGYKNALIDLEKREDENSKLIDRVEELEKSLDIQRGLRETAHVDSQATVQAIADKDAEILRLTQSLADSTREFQSLVAYLEAKGYHGEEEESAPKKVEDSANIEQLTEQLAENRMRVEELSQLLAASDEKLRAAETLAAEAATRCSEKEKEIADLKVEMQNVAASVAETTVRANELAQSFHTQFAQAQEQIAARNMEIAELRALVELPAEPISSPAVTVDVEFTDAEELPAAEEVVETPVEERAVEEASKEEVVSEEGIPTARGAEGFIAMMRDALEEAKAQKAANFALEDELALEREASANLREQLEIQVKELELTLADLQQEKAEMLKGEEVLREELARMRDEVAVKEAESEVANESAQAIKDEYTALLQKSEEDRHKEISALTLKLQLANEMNEMKAAVVAVPPPKQVASIEVQTEPVSSSYRRVSMQVSPTLLAEQLEAMQISNELLRGDNSSFQKKMDKMQEYQSVLQSKVRDAEAKAENVAQQLKAAKEAEQEQLQQIMFEHNEQTASLNATIQELMEQRNSSIEAQETVAEAKIAIERERTLHAKLTEQTSINQNLQNDLRLLYLKHKKDLAELQEEYKHEQYKDRYLEVVKDRNAIKMKLESLCKVMDGSNALYSKGGLVEAMKENLNTINIQYHATGAKLAQMKDFQASSLKAATNIKKLERKLKDQSSEIQKLIDEKTVDAGKWNVQRTEWEELCGKIVTERDSLRADNERVATISSRFEGLLKDEKDQNQILLGEISSLKEQADKMKETSEFLEVQLHSSEESVAQLETQLQDVQQQLASKEDELSATNERLEETSSALTSTQEERAALVSDVKQLHSKLILESVIANVERNGWKKTEKILTERINQLNLSITSYELAAQKNQEEAILKLNGEIAKLTAEGVRLNAELAKQTAEVARWSCAHKELSEFVEDERAIKDEQLQEAEEKVRDLDARLQRQVDVADGLLNDKQTQEFENKLLHEQVEYLQREVETGKDALLACQQDLKRMTDEKTYLEEQLEASHKSAIELQESFDKKVEELQAAKRQAEEEWSAKSTESNEQVQTVERELNAKLQAAAQANEALSSKIAEIEAQTTDTEQRFARKSELVQSLQDELAVFAECLKQKESETEDLTSKLQALLQANTQKEIELSVKENETAMRISQLQSELEIARNQTTQLQTENARLKKNNSELTSQTMAVNSRHLDAASKLRETIAQLTEKAEKATKDSEAAQKALADLQKSVADSAKLSSSLSEQDAAIESMKLAHIELDTQNKKLLDELKGKSVKLEEITTKMTACVANNNTLSAKVKELLAEKKSFEQHVALLSENLNKSRAQITTLEANSIKDQEAIEQLQQTSATAMANESKLESELHKAVGSIRALRNEKDKITAQLELCLKNAVDQEQSTILRMKFNLEREVAALTALNDNAKNESARLTEEMARYKESVSRFKTRTESKMKVQQANLQKAEEEVEALDTCLKQLRILLTRNEPSFSRVPDLAQLYQRLLAIMGAQQQTSPSSQQQ